jgi:polysaccharide transporter, PST family
MNAAWTKFLPGFLRAKLDSRYMLQAILGNSCWLLADKVVRMGVGLVVGVWIARYLGPEHFGQLSYAIAFVSLFSAIATLGLDGIVVRELVCNSEQKDEILGCAFTLKLIGGGVAFLIVLVAIWLVRPVDTRIHWMVGIIAAGMIFQAFDTADLWFQAQVQSKLTVLAKNAAFLVLAAVKVWLILIQADVTAFAWAATVEEG